MPAIFEVKVSKHDEIWLLQKEPAPGDILLIHRGIVLIASDKALRATIDESRSDQPLEMLMEYALSHIPDRIRCVLVPDSKPIHFFTEFKDNSSSSPSALI